MKVTTQVDVERLGENQLLAFYTEIGTATLGERKFDILRSMTGLQFGLYEHAEDGLVIHTVNVNPVIQAALEAVIGDAPDQPPFGSIVLLHGRTGTAYQRFFRDGLWHADGLAPLTWDDITAEGVRVQVVYTAPVDPS